MSVSSTDESESRRSADDFLARGFGVLPFRIVSASTVAKELGVMDAKFGPCGDRPSSWTAVAQ